ncbi:MAG: DUF4186 domain-containing protein [Ileibacterium sp.]|nr:DUF4186 domain-containing protein [Ileibacterium sp.]
MSFVPNPEYFDSLFQRLDGSKFRSSFHLRKKEMEYLMQKGMPTVRKDAAFFIETRLAAAWPDNDGKQTPMKNHPVFIAQHACGCCCRGCLQKWHGIPKGRPLNTFEKQYIEEVLMQWLQKELDRKKENK